MKFFLLTIIYIINYGSSQKIKTLLVQEWAENFGTKLFEICSKATSLNKITNNFVSNGATVTKLDGMDVVQSMANKIEGMLQSKVESVKRLVDTAEEAYKEYIPNKEIQFDYFNAKEVVDANSGQNIEGKITMIFKPHEQFDNIPINLTYSTIHVPTNVYNRDVEVLNNIAWSEKLNKVFVDNYQRDRTLMWQYFGSETGFFRIFPGLKWELDKSNIDLYDCRVKDWYIQAATSPKDLIILLDGSGSMTGLRIEIAKLTIETIMNTLSDDDFFNVIQFTGEPLFVEGCFNETLVQGNEDNKNKIKEKLENVYTKEIAKFDIALTKAFNLLNSTRENNRGTNCNQAIMIITDGAPNNYPQLFEDFNAEKRVRIFTYLIGREATDSNGYLKWMSCNNKGYFTHIATLADVQENVQEYIKVISRPMVIEQEHVTIWTGIYHTKADPKTKNWLSLLEEEMDKDEDTIRLMTSVAQPVFDRKNATHGEGNLLGVMGTDVPIEEIIKLTPQYRLGPNGYSFAITNNGYILFHPDLRPMFGKSTKPNYNSVDLSEVEMSDTENPFGRNFDMKLRRDMLDQKTSNLTMRVKIAYDQMRRVDIRENNYYFTTLLRTPFSLGIALPKNKLVAIKGAAQIDQIDIERDFGGSLWKVVPDWVYCRLPNEENTLNDRNRIVKFIKLAQQASHPTSSLSDKFQDEYRFYTENCDKDLIMSLAFDAKVTAPILKDWYESESFAQANGIELIFLGTRSGLTRFYDVNQVNSNMVKSNPEEPSLGHSVRSNDISFMDKQTKTVEELYYKRADAVGPDKFVFSVEHNNFPDYTFVFYDGPGGTDDQQNDEYANEFTKSDNNVTHPFNNGSLKSNETLLPDMIPVPSPFTNMSFYKKEESGTVRGNNNINYPNILVTASSAIVIKGLTSNIEQSSTAAVVGLRMNLDSLAQIFYNTSSPSINCFSEGSMCYLLDEHAYVILSSGQTPRHIGKFFGQVDGRIMRTLSNHVYKKVAMYDYQAMCETKVSIFSSALNRLMMPFSNHPFFQILFVMPFKYLSNFYYFYPQTKSSLHSLIMGRRQTFQINPVILNCLQQSFPLTCNIFGTWKYLFVLPQILFDLVSSAAASPKTHFTTTTSSSSNPTTSFISKDPFIPSALEEELEDERPNDIKVFKAPHPCVKRYYLFTLNRYLLQNEGPVSLISNCGGKPVFSPITSSRHDKLRFCGKPFIVSLVPYTNLVLLVARKAQSSLFDSSSSSDIFMEDDNIREKSLAPSKINTSASSKMQLKKDKNDEKFGSSSTSTTNKDICSMCDDLVYNYQPKSISLKHEEVLDESSLQHSPPTDHVDQDDIERENEFEDLDETYIKELLKTQPAQKQSGRSESNDLFDRQNLEKLLKAKKARAKSWLKYKNKCYGVKTNIYRRRPTTCYSHNKLENTELCGSAFSICSSFSAIKSLFISLLIYVIWHSLDI